MFRVKCLLVPFALAAVYAGCGESAAIGGDSETHFLMRCAQSCAGDLECVCGVCTKLCDEGTACASLSKGASCGASAEAGCTEQRRICEVTCDRDSDCSALGEKHRCEGGVCRAPANSSNGGVGGSAGTTTSRNVTSSVGGTTQTSAGIAGAGGAESDSCCLAEDIHWTLSGGLSDDGAEYSHSLSGCNSFEHDVLLAASNCASDLPCPGDPDRQFELTGPDLNQLLEHPDMRTALEQAPVTYGRDSRPVDGYALVIDVGDAQIVVGDPCNDADDNCVPIPVGVDALRQALDQIVMQQIDQPNCEQDAQCLELPLPMTCDSRFPYWFFNPDTHRCESSEGCLGEANTFPSRRECEQACDNDPCSYGQPVASSSECADGMVAAGSMTGGDVHCFETQAQACECACFAQGGSLKDCEQLVVLDTPVREATCTPPGF